MCYRGYQRSIEHALAAHRIAAEAGDIRQQAWAMAYAAFGYRELGDSGRRADLGRRSAALARQAGDQEAYSQALARLGDGLHGLGRPGEAMDVRLRLAALLTTPGNAIHPELAAVALASASSISAPTTRRLRRAVSPAARPASEQCPRCRGSRRSCRRALGLKGFGQGAQLEDSRDHRPQLLAVDERGQLAKLAAVGLDDEVHTADVVAPRRGRVGFLGDGDQDAAAAQQRPGACGGAAANGVDDDVNIVDVVLEPAGVVEDVVRPRAR